MRVDAEASGLLGDAGSTSLCQLGRPRNNGKCVHFALAQDVLLVAHDLSVTGDKAIVAQQDKTTVVFDQNGLSINGAGEILIHNQKGRVRILDDGSLQIEAEVPLEIRAGGCSLKLDNGALTIKGTKVQIDPGPGQVAPAAPKPATTSLAPKPGDTTWVEIELIDELGDPISGEPFIVRFADGTSRRGRLGADGRAHVPCPKPGPCEVLFMRRDGPLVRWLRAIAPH